MFRAYDKATGKIIWEMELPAGTTGAPMTYMLNGKQYIVVAIGSRTCPASSSRWRFLRLVQRVTGPTFSGSLETRYNPASHSV